MTIYDPVFCNANYIKSDNITVSSNEAVKDRLIDRNPDRRWVSTVGDETATFTFTVTDEIDTIVIQNCNALTFTIKYDTSTDFDPALSQAVVTGENINIIDSDNNYLVDGSGEFIVSAGIASKTFNSFYFKFAKVTPTTNIVFSVTATTDGGAFRCGQFFIGKQILALKSSGSMRVMGQLQQHNKPMSDGTMNKIFVRQTTGIDLTLNNVSPQERANLLLLADINKRDAIYFVARPAMYTDYFDGVAGHFNWINEFDILNYYNDIQANGFTGVIRLREASGIQ
jgi:hypothetical protein